MTDLDRISELPSGLKEMVLVRLPIKEAIKTSFLSSKWRYVWTYIPDLVFSAGDTSAKLVDIVLLLHQGPIQKFVLEYHNGDLDDPIHRWMVILSKNGIRELNIDLSSSSRWKMPSSFFSTSSLTDVRIEHCVLKLPRSFYGLELLKSLQLYDCSIGDNDLQNLISSCSHLENLLLSGMENLFVTIRAPKLKRISILICGLKYIHFVTPILVDARFYLNFTIEQNSCNPILNNVFGSLCNIELLEIGSQLMKFLANWSNMEIPIEFTRLKKLDLSMDPSNLKENAFAVCIFQNAPNLEILEICTFNFSARSTILSTGTLWEPMMPTTSFGNLKLVNIYCYQEFIVEFTLPVVKLILATSPVLVSLRLAGPRVDENVVCLNKFKCFPRASKKAQIFVDPFPV